MPLTFLPVYVLPPDGKVAEQSAVGPPSPPELLEEPAEPELLEEPEEPELDWPPELELEVDEPEPEPDPELEDPDMAPDEPWPELEPASPRDPPLSPEDEQDASRAMAASRTRRERALM
jgi:hypothetical protein